MTGLAASPTASGVAAAGELGELELPPSCGHTKKAFKVTDHWFRTRVPNVFHCGPNWTMGTDAGACVKELPTYSSKTR